MATPGAQLDAELAKHALSNGTDQIEEPPLKKARLDEFAPPKQRNGQASQRQKGIAPVKAEYAIKMKTCACILTNRILGFSYQNPNSPSQQTPVQTMMPKQPPTRIVMKKRKERRTRRRILVRTRTARSEDLKMQRVSVRVGFFVRNSLRLHAHLARNVGSSMICVFT
jgi:hypothetical protein